MSWHPDDDAYVQEYDTAPEAAICVQCNQCYVSDPMSNLCVSCAPPPCARCRLAPCALPDALCRHCEILMDRQVRVHVEKLMVQMLPPTFASPSPAPYYPPPNFPPSNYAPNNFQVPPFTPPFGGYGLWPHRPRLLCSICRRNPVTYAERNCKSCAAEKRCFRCKCVLLNTDDTFCNECYADQPICGYASCHKKVHRFHLETRLWNVYCLNHNCRKCESDVAINNTHLCATCLAAQDDSKGEIKRILPPNNINKRPDSANPTKTAETDTKQTPKSLLEPKSSLEWIKQCKQCNKMLTQGDKKSQRAKSEFCVKCRCSVPNCTRVRASTDVDYCTTCAAGSRTCDSANCSVKIPAKFHTCIRCSREKLRGNVKCLGQGCLNYYASCDGTKMCASCTAKTNATKLQANPSKPAAKTNPPANLPKPSKSAS